MDFALPEARGGKWAGLGLWESISGSRALWQPKLPDTSGWWISRLGGEKGEVGGSTFRLKPGFVAEHRGGLFSEGVLAPHTLFSMGFLSVAKLSKAIRFI